MMPPMQWIGVTVIVIGQLCMAAVTIVLEGTIVDHWPMWVWIVIAAVTGIAALTLHFIYMRMMKRSNQDPFSIGAPPDPGTYSEEFLLKWQVNRITFNRNFQSLKFP